MRGPNRAASFFCDPGSNNPFVGFPRLPLASIRRFRLDIYGWELFRLSPDPIVFQHMSSFPALETFTVERETDLSLIHSALLSKHSLLSTARTPLRPGWTVLSSSIGAEYSQTLHQFVGSRYMSPLLTRTFGLAWNCRGICEEGFGSRQIFPDMNDVPPFFRNPACVYSFVAALSPSNVYAICRLSNLARRSQTLRFSPDLRIWPFCL